jgi:hypothetical protein
MGTMIEGWSWIGPWVRDALRRPVVRLEVVLPAAVSAVALLVYAWRGRMRSVVSPLRALTVLPLLAGLVFWFTGAPDPRFGMPLFWTLAGISLAAALTRLSIAQPRAAALPVLLLAAVPLTAAPISASLQGDASPVSAFARHILLKPGEDLWFDAVPSPTLAVKVTATGLRVHVPTADNRCWNAPLPCTPHPAQNLRLRRTGSLGAGFSVDGAWLQTEWPYRDSRFREFLQSRLH